MTPEDVYQQWKEQRSNIEPSDTFRSDVMSRLAEADADPSLVLHQGSTGSGAMTSTADAAMGLLDRPLWAALAVVAASVVGIIRVSFALIIVLF